MLFRALRISPSDDESGQDAAIGNREDFGSVVPASTAVNDAGVPFPA